MAKTVGGTIDSFCLLSLVTLGTVSKKNHISVLIGGARCCLVQILSAVLCAAQAVDLFVFDGELVIVSDLLPESDGLLRVNNDLLFAVDGDNFGVAVGLKISDILASSNSSLAKENKF